MNSILCFAGEDEEGGGSSGEEWIMRAELGKKKRRIVFGDGSEFQRPGKLSVVDTVNDGSHISITTLLKYKSHPYTLLHLCVYSQVNATF